jgi:hypothetical protein
LWKRKTCFSKTVFLVQRPNFSRHFRSFSWLSWEKPKKSLGFQGFTGATYGKTMEKPIFSCKKTMEKPVENRPNTAMELMRQLHPCGGSFLEAIFACRDASRWVPQKIQET